MPISNFTSELCSPWLSLHNGRNELLLGLEACCHWRPDIFSDVRLFPPPRYQSNVWNSPVEPLLLEYSLMTGPLLVSNVTHIAHMPTFFDVFFLWRYWVRKRLYGKCTLICCYLKVKFACRGHFHWTKVNSTKTRIFYVGSATFPNTELCILFLLNFKI